MPGFAIGQAGKSANGKLNIALVGVGGKGRGPTVGCLNENVVALCDVDEDRVKEGRKPAKDGTSPFDEALKTQHKLFWSLFQINTNMIRHCSYFEGAASG